MIRTIAIISVIFVLTSVTATTSDVQAQTRSWTSSQYSWGSPWYHSSTADESQARGLGALIRDWGEGNLLNAMAAGEIEKARSTYIRNTLDATQAYYDRKRIHDKYYAEKKIKKRAALDRFIARRGGVPELTAQDIDPSTGTIRWPAVLQLEAYDKFRIPYQRLAEQYFYEGTLAPAEFMELQRISREWRKQLGNDRHNFVIAHVRDSIRFILAIDKTLGGS